MAKSQTVNCHLFVSRVNKPRSPVDNKYRACHDLGFQRRRSESRLGLTPMAKSMLKNLLIKAFLAMFTKKHHKNVGVNRILIIATTALGDTLWATAAIESLRKSFPLAYIAVLTSPIGAQVLQHNPHLDRLYLLKEPLLPQFFSLRKKLLKELFDTILVFHASQRLILPLCSLLGAERIIGTQGINKGLDFLLTDPLPKRKEHEIARRLKMVEKIGGQTFAETLSFFLQPEEQLPAREGLWIAIHPGSKDAFKRWPKELFIKLGMQLKKALDCNILITGTKEELSLMQELTSAIPGAHLADPGLSLRKFAALLDQMDLLICNDTGPFHLACALNTPTIGIYAATDPLLCGPYKAPFATAIAKTASCTPCLKRKCRDSFCLLQIGPEEIATASLEMLSTKHQNKPLLKKGPSFLKVVQHS